MADLFGTLPGEAPSASPNEVDETEAEAGSVEPQPEPDEEEPVYDPEAAARGERVQRAPDNYTGWQFAEDIIATGANSTALNTLPLLNAAVYGTMGAAEYFVERGGRRAGPGGEGARVRVGDVLQIYQDEFKTSRDYFNSSRRDLQNLGGDEGTFWGNFAAGSADVAGTMPGIVMRAAGEGTKALGTLIGAATGTLKRQSERRAARGISNRLATAAENLAPAELIDNLILRSQSYNPGLRGFVHRNMHAAALGAGVGVVQDAVAGGIDFSGSFEDAMMGMGMSAFLNAGTSMGGQTVFGEFLMPLMYRANGDAALRPFAQRLLSEVQDPDEGNITPAQVIAAAERLDPSEQSLFDLTVPSDDIVDATRALNRALVSTAIPGVRPNQVTEPERAEYARRYMRAINNAFRAVENTTRKAGLRMQHAFGNARSREQILTTSNNNKNGLSDIYKDITRTTPWEDGRIPLGMAPVNSQEFLQDVRRQYEAALGGPLSTRKVEFQEIFDEFQNSITIRAADLARDMPGIDYLSADNNGNAVQIPVGMLLERGRQGLSDRLSLTAAEGLDRRQRYALQQLIGMVDTQIARTQLGNIPESVRKGWAEEMRSLDYWDMGNTFFNRRYQGGNPDLAYQTQNTNTAVRAQTLEEAMKTLRADPNGQRAIEAFQAGFAHAGAQYLTRSTPTAMLRMLLGEVDLGSPSLYFRQRNGEYEVLKQALGQEQLDSLIYASDSERLAEAQTAVHKFLADAQETGHVPSADLDQAARAATYYALSGPQNRGLLLGDYIAQSARRFYGDENLADASELMYVLGSAPQSVIAWRMAQVMEEIRRPRDQFGARPALAYESDNADQREQRERETTRDNMANRLNQGPSLFASPEEIDAFSETPPDTEELEEYLENPDG